MYGVVTESSVFAVGNGGVIVHYDGNDWSAGSSGYDHDIWGVWGTSGSNVYAVGEYENIYHYDGSTWTRIQNSIGGVYNVPLFGIWGTSESDIYAVGNWDSVFHYDGVAWTAETAYLYLFDVWGSSGTDIFAVGSWGNVFHYDGDTWEKMPRTTGSYLRGVWGSSGSDVFAVGYDGTILHYNGADWMAMESGTPNALYSVWGSASNNVYAVGFEGTILHYDGGDWDQMTTMTSENLRGIWGNSASNAYAVGDNGTILHYDGAQWLDVDPNMETLYDLWAVWGTSAADVTVVGDSGTMLHYDGTQWVELDPNLGVDFRDIWGTSASNIIAVGADLVVHYDGLSWYAVEREDISWYGVWGSSASDVFAVGDFNSILHFGGQTCSFEIDPRSATFPALGGSSTFSVDTTPENCIWNASPGTAGITVDYGCGIGDGVVSYTVGSTSYETLRVYHGDGPTLQHPAATGTCTYAIDPGGDQFGSEGGSGTFMITDSYDGCFWEAESQAYWLTLDSEASGTGNSTIAFSVDENTGTDDRTGILMVQGLSYVVKQSGNSTPVITLGGSASCQTK